MLSCEPGWTIANPPETAQRVRASVKCFASGLSEPHIGFAALVLECLERFMIHTEELLAATAFLINFNETWLQLFYRWHVVGKDPHFSRFCRDVDLNTATSNVSSGSSIERFRRSLRAGHTHRLICKWTKARSVDIQTHVL